MAIPKAYQMQNKGSPAAQGGGKAPNKGVSAEQTPSQMARNKSIQPIQLNKKRKYLRLGLVYATIYCFAKFSGIIEKWEAGAYDLEVFGISFSVGKRADAKVEKTATENPTAELSTNNLTSEVPPHKKPTAITLTTDQVGFDALSTSSDKEVALLQKLAARRQDFEKRETHLKEREFAVSVVEKQQKDKIEELNKLKESIELLLKKTDKSVQDQFTNLVKIYEGMKPKNAAQVFDRLDIAVLKDLIPLMSQRKVSSILDQMSVVKAKELSLILISNKNPFASTPHAEKK